MLLADPPPNRVLIGQQLGAGGWGDCLEPGLDWMTPKISVKSLARTIKEAGGDVEPSSWMVTRSRQWSPVGPQRPRPRGAPGLALSIWPQLGCYIPRVSPPPPFTAETLCGPLVATVLQAAWRGHVCHIPPCHPRRRRAVSWLPSCHTWMTPPRLGV